MNKYRVFLTKHYIAVEFYDIKAKDKKIAKRIALKVANKLKKDVRNEATDNGWIVDDPVEINYIGYSVAPFNPKLIYTDNKTNTEVYK